jgi:hypothetical protein
MGMMCYTAAHFCTSGEDTGWRFEKDGKEFFCSSHRKEFDTSRQVSLGHFVSHMGSDLRCVLCGQGQGPDSMRAFIVPGSVAGSSGSSMIALHSLCAKYTNVVVLEDDVSVNQCLSRKLTKCLSVQSHQVRWNVITAILVQ